MRIPALVLSTSLIAGCASTQSTQPYQPVSKPSAQVQKKEPPAPSRSPEKSSQCGHKDPEAVDKFQEGGEVDFTHVPGIGCLGREKGEINGVHYSINLMSGAARFYNQEEDPGYYGNDKVWIVNCETDSMTDARQCNITKGDFFLFWQGGDYVVSLLGDQYPQSDVVFRVDSNAPISGSEETGVGGSNAKKLINQMVNGQTLKTRYTSWPHETYKDSSMSTAGFQEALDYMNQLR